MKSGRCVMLMKGVVVREDEEEMQLVALDWERRELYAVEFHSETMRKGQQNNMLKNHQSHSSVCCEY